MATMHGADGVGSASHIHLISRPDPLATEANAWLWRGGF